jgi:hypothetical protein
MAKRKRKGPSNRVIARREGSNWELREKRKQKLRGPPPPWGGSTVRRRELLTSRLGAAFPTRYGLGGHSATIKLRHDPESFRFATMRACGRAEKRHRRRRVPCAR